MKSFGIITILTVVGSGHTNPQSTLQSLQVFGSYDNTLRNVQVIFRHGYRSPLQVTWRDSCLPQSQLGQLTQRGAWQMTSLGRYLRTRYGDYLGKTPIHVDVYSSAIGRCLASAKYVCKGLFPDLEHAWEPNIGILPSYMIAYGTPYSSLSLDGYESLLEYLKDKTIERVTSPSDLNHVVNQMLCQMNMEGCQLPEWLSGTIQRDLLTFGDAMAASYQTCQPRDPFYRTTSAMMWNLTQFFNTSNPTRPDGKFAALFSMHDTNLVELLGRWKAFDNKIVPFGAAIYLELHRISNSHYVRLFYDNSESHQPVQIQIPGCDWDCPYLDFARFTLNPSRC